MSDKNLGDQDNSDEVENKDKSSLVEQPIEKILKDDSIDDSIKLAMVVRQEIRETGMSFSGPIPPPTILKGYEDILPGSADRILSMTEKEGDHRRKIENKIVTTDVIRSFLGLGAGFIIAIVGLGGSIYLGINDKKWASGIMSAGTLTGLVTVFVKADQRRQEKREEDQE